MAADVPVPPPSKPDGGHKKKIVKGDPRITVMCEEVETIIFGPRFDPEKTHGRRRNKAKRTIGDDAEEDGWTDYSSHNNGAQSDTSDGPAPTSASIADSNSDDDTASETSAGGVTLSNNHPDTEKSDNTDTATGPTDASQRIDRHGNVLSDHKNFGAGKVRPAQLDAEVNFSVGGERGWAEKLEETPEMLEKRREGQKKADEKESVRCAARRLCAFGYEVKGEAGGEKERVEESEDGGRKKKGKGKRAGKGSVDVDAEEEELKRGNAPGVKDKDKVRMKKCEAVMSAAVVEASFAKGEWGIRWREDQTA